MTNTHISRGTPYSIHSISNCHLPPMSQDTGDDPPIEIDLCQNCGQALQGEYCSNCGQRNKEFIRFFPTLITEAFEGLFAFNSRTYITLWYLLSRPAYLSNEYLKGRRTQYLPPLRLFFSFFIGLHFFHFRGIILGFRRSRSGQ